MKSTFLASAVIAAGLIAIPVTSHAQDKGGFFVNGSVGQANLNEGIYDGSNTGYDVNVGYRWALAPEFALGIEGGYADLGSYTAKSNINYPTTGPALHKADISGWTLGVNGRWTVAEAWYISGRTGLFSADVKGNYYGAGNVPYYVDGSSSDWYAGLGFGYDFSNNFGLGLSYDWYNAGKNDLNLNTGLFSVTGEVRF